MATIDHSISPQRYIGVSADFHTAVHALNNDFQPAYSNLLNTKHRPASLFTNNFEVIDPARYEGLFGWIFKIIDMITKGSTDSLDVATKLSTVFSDKTIEKVKTHLIGDDDSDDHLKKMTTTKVDILIGQLEHLQASFVGKHKNKKNEEAANKLFNQVSQKLKALRAEMPQIQIEKYKAANPIKDPKTLTASDHAAAGNLAEFLKASRQAFSAA